MANNYVTKPYLQTQFQNYSEVIKDNFAKKDDVSTEKLEYTTTKDENVTNVKEALDTLFAGGTGEGGDENAIESISVNGTALTPDADKNVDITVPTISAEQDNALIQKTDGLYVPTVSETKVSQEQNNIIVSKEDGLFAEDAIVEIKVDGTAVPITDKTVDIALKSVTDLENYYNKEEVDDLLEAITTLNIEVVTALPTTDISTTKIYLVPTTDTTEQNVYDEYINTTADETGWECIGSTKVDLTNFYTKEETENLIKDELYVDNVIPAHYEIADSSTPNALEVVTDGTATDGQIDLSNVADIGANIGDFVVFVDEVTTTDTKYAEKTNVYSKSETDEKIAEAVTGGTVSLDGYVQKTELETTLEDYTTDDELTTALADYTKTTELDTKLEDYVLDSEMEIIDVTTLESMLGLSTEELEGLSQIIDDTQIVLNKTYSSSMIYSSIAQCLEDSKAYTLSELAKSIGASYKVVTSVDQMTDSKVLYLLKDADSGIYNIYVYDADTSTAELIGSFEINLDDYLKISDAEAQYVKQTDLVANYATKQEVVDGYATKSELQDAIADVEVEISTDENNQLENRENGLYVGKQYIEITEAYYEALSDEEKNNGIPYYIKDANPTQSGSVSTDAETLGGYSADDFAKTTDLANYLPLSGGDIKGEGTTPLGISGDNYVACYLDFKRPDSLILGALGFYGDKPVFVPSDYSATRELLHAGNIADYACTTSVADVDKASITSSDETYVSFSGDTHNWYYIKNGVCYYSFYIKINTVSPTWISIYTGLPKPYAPIITSVPSYGDSVSDTPASIYITENGTMSIAKGDVGNYYIGNGSYHVAEN